MNKWAVLKQLQKKALLEELSTNEIDTLAQFINEKLEQDTLNILKVWEKEFYKTLPPGIRRF